MKKITEYKHIKFLVLIIILMIIFSIAFFAYRNEKYANQDVITVNVAGGADFKSIQKAINVAKPGAKVYVHIGNYSENLLIDKPLVLEGENKELTYINGKSFNNIPLIDHDPVPLLIIENTHDVHISNLTYNKFDSHDGSGIQVHDSEQIIIENIYITSIYHALWIKNTEFSIFSNNTFYECRNAVVFDNSFNNLFTHSSIISDSWWGLYTGFDAGYNEISYNIFDSPDGQNELQIMWDSGPANRFHHNNFIEPSMEYHPDWGYTGIQLFDDGNGEGNYWSDYTGNDTNADGIGDTELPWHYDSYPLINPVETAGVLT